MCLGGDGMFYETLEETKQFIIDSDPAQVFISSMVPYPGTDVGDNPEKYGIINISKDYSQFYQVSSTGFGGLTFDSKWLTREDFRKLEIDFRNWIHKRPMRGMLQDYEIKMKKKEMLNE